MEVFQSFAAYLDANPTMVVLLTLWEGVWTLLACWFAARNNQKLWFLAVGFLQLLGILEIIYLATQTKFFKNFNLND